MDFACPLETEPSITTVSGIRYIQAEGGNETHDDSSPSLDEMVAAAANQAAVDLFLGPNVENPDPALVNCTLYPERSRPVKTTIQPGDLVVIMQSFNELDFVYAEPGAIFSNRNGHFHHEDFIGKKPFGSKIRSRNNRGYGFCYLLKPTPELWARSLNHRTQIVHELDQSMIIFQLHLRPNCIVVESGTGSGAMSHGFCRTIAPAGHLHTYEFNKKRAETARAEFSKNGVDHLVTVHHKDVCGKHGAGGFDLPAASVDAVFLDLPEPWCAVPHAAYILKPNASIATYSPCVEQTQRTVEALKAAGFHSMKTMEYRLQEHYVDEIEYEQPPTAKRPKLQPHSQARYEANASGSGKDGDDDMGAESDTKKSDDGATDADPSVATADSGIAAAEDIVAPTKDERKGLVARPFVMMRGHSAFLTFAMAGLIPQPNPNNGKSSATEAASAV